MIKLIKKQSGFTMIEALVAITILLLAVLGPLSLIAKGLGDALFAKNQITAFYLAEEGLEMVISKRNQFVFEDDPCDGSNPTDTDTECRLKGDSWIRGYNQELDSCFTGAGCDISINDDSQITACSSSPNPPGCQLYLPIDSATNQATGFYDSVSSSVNDEATIFRRSILITPIADNNAGALDSSNEAQIRVTVFWHNREVPKQLTVIGHLSRTLLSDSN